jgi:hypothetical protein
MRLMVEKGTVRRYGQQLDACVVYDNFDYHEGIKHQLISTHGEMRSVTTGKVFRGVDIPPGGLKKSMLHREVPLTIHDLLSSPGAACYDEVSAEIDTFFIAEAIRTAYPGPVKVTFAKPDVSYPVMPAVELLEPRTTDDKEFDNRLFLAYGDQKTSSLIRSMQREQVEVSSAYDRKDWLIGVAALFHLRMNYLWLMQRTHYGNMEQQDASTLYHHINSSGK